MAAKEPKEHVKVDAAVIRAIFADPPGGRACDLCCNRPWWPANGFSEAARLEWCETFGCAPCPPE